MSKNYERKLIVIGKTGTGKSSLANALLGRREFVEDGGFNAVTKECRTGRDKGHVSVVDTPGLFDCDGDRTLLEQALEVQKAIKDCPNPHAFLIVLNGSSRKTQEELSTIDILCMIFGEQCLKRAIIVLTHIENSLEETQLRERIRKSKEMSLLIKRCGNRFARIENKDPKPEHKQRIIELVDVVSREGRYNFKNSYMHVHEKVMSEQAAIQNQDSGPVHEQIKRLSEKIMKAVEEEKKFRKKCVLVGVCSVVVIKAFLLYFGGGCAAIATAGTSEFVKSEVLENSANIATELIKSSLTSAAGMS